MSKPITLTPISDSPSKTDLPSVQIEEIKTTVAEFLQEQADNDKAKLYGIVDSARNDEVFRLMITSDVEYKSLFEGTMDVQSFGVSGFLVECIQDSPLFNWMTIEAWGQSSCIFFTSRKDFDYLLTHLQKFNRVYLEGEDVVLFRYYDPRVLRVFLPTCTRTEIETFFGPVINFIAEDEKPELLTVFRFTGEKDKELETTKHKIVNVKKI